MIKLNYYLNLTKNLYKIITIIFIKNIDDIRIKYINITKITISKNLNIAKVFFTFLDNKNIKKKINILKNSIKYINKIIRKKKYLYIIPKLIFIYDKLLIKNINVINLINNLNIKN